MIQWDFSLWPQSIPVRKRSLPLSFCVTGALFHALLCHFTCSYIDLADFPDARTAAAYINKVASNETLYRSYLWYRYADADLQAKVREWMLRDGGFYTSDFASVNRAFLLSAMTLVSK